MNRVIFVCQVFYPDEQATSQLFSDLFAELAARGRGCEVLAGFPVDPAKQRSAVCDETWRGVRIRRGGLKVNYKRSLLARAAGYGSYCLWLMWRLIFRVPGEARILVATNPPFAPVLVHWCSRFRNWTYDVMLLDVYPDGLVGVGKLREGSVITALWRRLNRRAFDSAQRVLVLGRDMAQLCATRYGVPESRLHYTPHWSPMEVNDEVRPEKTRLWSQLGLTNEFVVQYSGNMGLWHDIECIIRAAALLRDEPDLKLLMIGGGMRRAAAEQLSRDLGLKNIMWLPYQPKGQLADSLSCCHAALISQRARLAGVAVPCKIYGILASGRAVLAQVPADSEVALVLKEEECGYATLPGDAEALAAAIRIMAGDRAEATAQGHRAYRAYRKKYTVQIAATTFARILYGEVASPGITT